MSHERCFYLDGREPLVHSFDPHTGLRHASYPLPPSLEGEARLSAGVDALVERLPEDAAFLDLVRRTDGGMSVAAGSSDFAERYGRPPVLARGAPTSADVAAIVRETVRTWVEGPDKPDPKVACVGDINMGPCCDFAEDVVMILEERHPGLVAEVEDYETELNRQGLTANGIHYYVRIGGTVYDASAPDGVPDPSLLSTCRSIRICADPLEAEEDAVMVPTP